MSGSNVKMRNVLISPNKTSPGLRGTNAVKTTNVHVCLCVSDPRSAERGQDFCRSPAGTSADAHRRESRAIISHMSAARLGAGWSQGGDGHTERTPHMWLPRGARLNRAAADVGGRAARLHCTHHRCHGTLTKYRQLGKYCG